MAQTDDERRAYQRGYQAGVKTAGRRTSAMAESWCQLRREAARLIDAVENYCLAVEKSSGSVLAYQEMRAALNAVQGDDIVGMKLKIAADPARHNQEARG
jgi:ribosome modulation factor